MAARAPASAARAVSRETASSRTASPGRICARRSRSALMTVPIARLFGGSWKQGVITGLAMGVVLYLVFDRLLDVVLPAGLLKGLL